MPEATPSPSRSSSSWTTATWAAWGLSLWSARRALAPLLLALPILGSAPGCCSPAPIPRTLPGPLLPVGKPPEREPEIQRGLDGADLEGEAWVIPATLLEEILADRLEWRAWAQALEAAGRWR